MAFIPPWLYELLAIGVAILMISAPVWVYFILKAVIAEFKNSGPERGIKRGLRLLVFSSRLVLFLSLGLGSPTMGLWLLPTIPKEVERFKPEHAGYTQCMEHAPYDTTLEWLDAFRRCLNKAHLKDK